MTVYIDDAYIETPAGTVLSRRALWCHLTADTKEELHWFARSIGLKREWFQDKPNGLWHYDVTKTVRAKCVKAGAVEIEYMNSDDFQRVYCNPEREGVAERVNNPLWEISRCEKHNRMGCVPCRAKGK